MDRCGLNAADFWHYVAALRDSNTSTVEAHLMDMASRDVLTLTDHVLDGQVNVDTTSSPVRQLSLTLSDPNHTFGYDSNSAADSGMFADRMVHVARRTFVPALNEHVTCPLFTGPVRGFQRDGTQVSLTGHGKEVLAQGALWETLHIGKGVRKTDAFRTIMGRAGETRYNVPDLPARLPTPLSLGRYAIPWDAARHLSSSMDRQAFYDATGRLIMRAHPSRPVFTLRHGDTADGPSDLIHDLQVSIDLSGQWYNVIEVVGAKPKGSKTRIRAVAVAPPSSPLDPYAVGQNGKPLRHVQTVQNDHIRTHAEAQAKADRLLADQLRAVVSVTGDFKVFPFLEEGDTLRIQSTQHGSLEFRLDQFTIPLSAGSPMTIGYTKQVRLMRKHPRPKRKAHHK